MDNFENNDVTVRLSQLGTEEKDLENGRTCDSSETRYSSKRSSCLSTMSLKVVSYVEMLCGRWGYLVAIHPVMAIICTFLLVITLGCGLFYITLIFKPYDLWVPRNSEFYKVTQWKNDHFPTKCRNQYAMWEADNVLTASLIKEMWKLHVEVMNVKVQAGDQSFMWKDICAQIPADFNEEINYLSQAQGLNGYACVEGSLLELWKYDKNIIANLTDEKVVAAINSITKSQHYGNKIKLSQFVGGITRDSDGKILKAKFTVQMWKTKVNNEMIADGQFEVDVGSGDKVDSAGMAWERKLVDLIHKWNQDGFFINVNADHTMGDVLFYSLAQDALWIGVGWAVLLGYVIFTLGRPFKHDQRIIPALMGLLGIALSVIGSYGACAMMAVPYGTLTNVLPVLLVAIGVDDMYVIATAWDSTDHKVGGLGKKAQLTMERAGMAITVTSITDILAFSVGCITTDLPGLRYFCIYATMGIVMVYFIQATLFVAVLVLNQRRIDSKMNKKSFTLNFKGDYLKSSIRDSGFIMKLYSRFLMLPFVKGVVIALTSVMFLFSCFTLNHISREFDTFWLVPESSDFHKFINTIEESFPQKREIGNVFFKGVDIPKDLDELNDLITRIENLPEVFEVNAWFQGIDANRIIEDYPWILSMSKSEQCKMLVDTLGPAFYDHFPNEYENQDYDYEGNSTHPCSTFKIEYLYIPPITYEAKQEAMAAVRNLVAETNVSGFKAAWAHKFSQWETDRIILKELLQSLGIVLLAVGVISIILLASVRTALLVLLCVIGTLVNVASFVHFWGLTINTVTGIAFVLAIGICVDYAAHIGHDFLITPGSRNERAMSALNHMGLAVIHGGCSTFITFVLLSPSDSYIYVSYFKILSSVSVFGLYHALFFLPVMLSLIGSNRYQTKMTVAIDNDDFPSIRPVSKSIYHMSLPYIHSKGDIFSHSETKTVRRPTHRKSRSLPSYSFFLSSVPYQQPSLVINNPASRTTSNKSLRHSSFNSIKL